MIYFHRLDYQIPVTYEETLKKNKFKGKLALNFTFFYLVLISCLSDMVRTFIIDKNTSLQGGIPLKYKGIPLSDNPIYAKSNYKEK